MIVSTTLLTASEAPVKVHLVDGTYELFRSYFGAPKRQVEGREVGATAGLVATLLALLAEEGVSHVAVAFDHVIESFRNRLFAGYKTGDGVEPELLAQFGLAETAARALGLVVWPMVEFEADDAMATAAARWEGEPEVEQVVLCSPDKDLAQCVREDRVVCLDRRRQKVLDEAGVVGKFGVAPSAIPDWLALVGDAADGIPGVPRWGAKSAAAVLFRYGRLEDIPPDPGSWDVPVRGAEALARSLSEVGEAVFLYRRLATLRLDVPLGEELADLHWRGARRQAVEELADELGRPEVFGRIDSWR
jgi:5'-3' exonuclease